MTEKGSILNFGHRIDCNGVGVLRGLRHIPSKNYPKYPPLAPYIEGVVQNHHAGEKGTHWDRANKDLTPFEIAFSLCLSSPQCTPRQLLSLTRQDPREPMLFSMVVLYHMNDLQTGKHLWHQVVQLTDGAVMARLASVTEATPVNPFWRGAVWFCRLDSEVLASPMV